MVIVPPLIAVVPEVAFWMSELATTVELNVVVPVEVREILPKPCEPPTAPVKVTLPEPEVIVKSLVVDAAELSVEVKLMAPLAEPLLLELRVTLALSLTGPV